MFKVIAFFTPNFRISSPLNFLFVLLVFVGFFSFTSIANAFEDDGTWDQGYFYWDNGVVSTVGSTVTEHCTAKGPTYYRNGGGCSSNVNTSGNIYYPHKGSCSDLAPHFPAVAAACSGTPDPVEPQSCTDLADQNPDGADVTIEGYAAEICSKGCKAIPALVMRSPDSDTWSGTAFYTTEDCNGGFDLAKPDEKLQDEYQHDAQLQNCHDSTGRLIGQISASATCPTLSVCYDPSTGAAVGTTSTSTSCQTGVKYNELSSSLKPVTADSSTQSTINSDGTSTEVKETITTETGLDGSTETTKTTTTTEKDAAGNETSSNTTTQKETRKSTVSCSSRPDLPECAKKDDSQATAKLSDNCVTPPVCTGDPVGCASVELQWQQMCDAKPATEQEFETWKNQQSVKDQYGVDVDENGMLTSLNKGELNVQTALNLDQLGDNGSAGSCPAPHGLGLLGTVIEFKYDTICSFADSIRPLIIFSSIFLCMVMVRRSVVGA